MDRGTKKGLIILLSVVVVLMTMLGLDAWWKRQNKFVYEQHLDDVVLTVNDSSLTLREFGIYIYEVETKVDEQARIYNPEDPMDYWNTYFSSGVEGGYISQMSRDVALESCVCDMIYEDMARDAGYELTEEEMKEAAKNGEQVWSTMSEAQVRITGITKDLAVKVYQRKRLVQKFAADYYENVDFTGYCGYREELVSYAGEYYLDNILPKNEVTYNRTIVNDLQLGRITTGYEVE